MSQIRYLLLFRNRGYFYDLKNLFDEKLNEARFNEHETLWETNVGLTCQWHGLRAAVQIQRLYNRIDEGSRWNLTLLVKDENSATLRQAALPGELIEADLVSSPKLERIISGSEVDSGRTLPWRELGRPYLRATVFIGILRAVITRPPNLQLTLMERKLPFFDISTEPQH